jgi:hypothetical protein
MFWILDMNPQRCGNKQAEIYVYIPRYKLGTVSCKVHEMVHMRLTPQHRGHKQVEGNRRSVRARTRLPNRSRAGKSECRDLVITFHQ